MRSYFVEDNEQFQQRSSNLATQSNLQQRPTVHTSILQRPLSSLPKVAVEDYDNWVPML